MSRHTEHSVRAAWRTLDPAVRREIDDDVAAGHATSHAALGTIALWRALRLRRHWSLALVLTPLTLAAAVTPLLLGGNREAVVATLRSPATAALVLTALAIPVRRLWVLRRAVAANCDVALSGPQLTDRSSRAASELSRHLALRAAKARIQGSDSDA